MAVPYLSADAIYISEYFLNERGGFQSEFLMGGFGVVPKGWHTVDFIVDEMMDSTLVERQYVFGRRIDWLSNLVNIWWLNLPWWQISGQYDFQPLAVM